MSYQVKQGDIFGRVGQGLGGGLSEQLPQEVERHRLSQGLKNLENQPNLTPAQRYGRLLTLPGMTPQGLQGYSDIIRQEMRGKALGETGPKPSPFPEKSVKEQAQNSEIPSLTQEKPFEEAQKGYIPPTQEEIYQIAGEQYNSNPALFGNDPDKAIAWAQEKANREQQINQAYQTKHKNLSDIQDNVVKRLQAHSTRLGANKVPANTYSKIEDRAIQDTKPKNEGGRGLTEQQAMKEYGEELDKVSRDYSAVDALGNWGIVGRPASNTLANLKALQKKFETRGDTENFADTLVAENGLSNPMAYSIAQPVSREKLLNNAISKLPQVHLTKSEDPVYETSLIAPKLAKSLGEKGSPLAVAHELKQKGYDPNAWLDYVDDHREELKLMDWQGRQLDKARNLLPTWNDWWLGAWSGINQSQENK